MLTHSQIHQLVSQRKMTPERAADILVGRRSYWDQSQAKGLLAKLGLLVLALFASVLGVRPDRF